MAEHQEPVDRQRAATRLADSPWFWLLVFANAAIVGLAVIGPKYNVRQAAVERRFEARREVARQAYEQAGRGEGVEASAAEETAPHELTPLADSAHIVPLFPLAVTLIICNLLAIVLFTYSRIRLMRSEAPNPPPPRP